MSTPFAPIDAATIASLNKGDEAALEQIFRTHYDVLLERALERLKDEKAAAPRLVAAVIRELWEEREGFHSSAEIEGFCNEEFRHRARAVRSRMAAVHRFEKTEGVKAHEGHAPPTADQLWTEIVASLHKPPVDPTAAAKARREHAAHDAAAHIGSVARTRSWKGPALLLVVGAVALWAGYTWAMKSSKSSLVTQLLAATDAPSVATRPGQLGSFSLADSTVIRLGADSKLVRVQNFGKEFRSALVGGTANVTVGTGSALPLEIRLGDASIVATGGEFAVRDFAEEPFRYVLARTGDLKVTVGETERPVKAGEAVTISREGVVADASADDRAHAFTWLDGKYVAKEVTVKEALADLYRWYGLDIAIPDSSVLTRTLTIDVPLESSQAAIAAMEGGADLHFEWMDKRMALTPAKKR